MCVYVIEFRHKKDPYYVGQCEFELNKTEREKLESIIDLPDDMTIGLTINMEKPKVSINNSAVIVLNGIFDIEYTIDHRNKLYLVGLRDCILDFSGLESQTKQDYVWYRTGSITIKKCSQKYVSEIREEKGKSISDTIEPQIKKLSKLISEMQEFKSNNGIEK